MRHTIISTTKTNASKQTASKTLAALLTLAVLTACSADNAGEPASTVTIDIPVEIYSANAATTRAADQGDPGNDASLQAPKYLYVYAYVSETEGSNHELLTQRFTFTDKEVATAWTKRDANTTSERWVKNVRVTFEIARTFNNSLGSSRVYAIASRDDLSGVLPTDMSSYTTKDALEALTADLSGFTSSQLKDIYSTPKNDQSSPVLSTDNGIIMSNNNTLTCSTVKLYHVAAKADFTWEVPESLRKTVALQRIKCTGLPTTCKIFEPTDNPTTATASSVVLDVANSTDNPAFVVNEGNKWLGRAYAYVLQPPSPGTINYTVTYGGSSLRQDTTGSITPSNDAYSHVFTGWYRVIAEVK